MSIHTEIEIARSPEQVRQTFLDFPSYHEWTNGFIKSITPADPAAAPGTKLTAVLDSSTVSPTVLANSPTEFRWRGTLWGIPGLFNVQHKFFFEPSKTTPGATTFVQAEKFSGALSFIVADGTGFHKKIKGGFEGFNADLKKRCESERAT